MAWTTPATWTAGEVPSDTKLNAQVRDNHSVLSTHAHTGAAGDGASADELLANMTFFGDGSDGALLVSSGTTTIDTSHKNYTTVTVDVGATLVVRGVIVRAQQYIEINGTLHNDGVAGTDNTSDPAAGGTAFSAVSPLIAGTDGGDGATSPVSASDVASAGNGGGSTSGAAKSGVAAQTAGVQGGGGGSGASANTGTGGGGSGAGPVDLRAPEIRGSGTIRATGGAGGAAKASSNGWGGNGGGGGKIRTISIEEVDAGLTFTSGGGAAGAKDGSGTIGTAGVAGAVEHIELKVA